MIPASCVKANVIDIRKRTVTPPPQLAPDANVLYWQFYYNFSSLRYAGGKQPHFYQLNCYPAFWRQAASTGTTFHVTPTTLGEFARTAEYAELETIWLTDPFRPQPDPSRPVTQFDPRVCKFARYHYARQLGNVRSAVGAMVTSVRKVVSLLSQFPTAEDLQKSALQEWQTSSGDFSDAFLVASARYAGILSILYDDMDLATFDGVTLFTANQQTITAASAAGKLI